MKDLNTTLHDFKKQEDFMIKALFLTGALWPLLSLLLLSGYYLFFWDLENNYKATFNKATSLWLVYSLSEFVVAFLLVLISTNASVMMNLSFYTYLLLNVFAYSLSAFYYFKWAVIFLNIFSIIKFKRLIIPIPKKLIFNVSSVLDGLNLKEFKNEKV
jgi:hypothetical protein